jgi:DNA-binding XRE family transcriptional regulator
MPMATAPKRPGPTSFAADRELADLAKSLTLAAIVKRPVGRLRQSSSGLYGWAFRSRDGMKRAKKRVSPRIANTSDAYIAARMREYRTAIGLSQEALGEKLGISYQQVEKYERGMNRVSASRLSISAKF